MTASKPARRRFFVEAALGAGTLMLAIVTLIDAEWIEAIFDVDPDGGSGALEWLIVAVLAVSTVVFGLLARTEWRRRATA